MVRFAIQYYLDHTHRVLKKDVPNFNRNKVYAIHPAETSLKETSPAEVSAEIYAEKHRFYYRYIFLAPGIYLYRQ